MAAPAARVQYKGSSISSEVAEKVEIGGLVGRMMGGSLTDSSTSNTDASGSIELASTKKSNSSYIIGGAVGCETADGTTYSNVKVNVAVDANWATSTSLNKHYSPANLGKVGKFIGYVENGKFTNCSGFGTSDAAYQFLGEINASFTPTTSSNGLFILSSTSGSIDGAEKSMTAVKSTDIVYTVGNFTFTRTTLDGTYKYSAELGNCLYLATVCIMIKQMIPTTIRRYLMTVCTTIRATMCRMALQRFQRSIREIR